MIFVNISNSRCNDIDPLRISGVMLLFYFCFCYCQLDWIPMRTQTLMIAFIFCYFHNIKAWSINSNNKQVLPFCVMVMVTYSLLSSFATLSKASRRFLPQYEGIFILTFFKGAISPRLPPVPSVLSIILICKYVCIISWQLMHALQGFFLPPLCLQNYPRQLPFLPIVRFKFSNDYSFCIILFLELILHLTKQ